MLQAGVMPLSLSETRSKFPGPASTSDLCSASLQAWLLVGTLTSRCHLGATNRARTVAGRWHSSTYMCLEYPPEEQDFADRCGAEWHSRSGH